MKTKLRTDLDPDTILLEIGRFGKYQAVNVLLYMIPALFSAVLASEYIFTAKNVPYRCFVPECEFNLSSATYQSDWLELAIPQGGKCTRFAVRHESLAGSCSAENFDRNRTIPCEHYVFGQNDSMIQEFNIPCEEWKQSLIGTTFNVAYLMVLPIIGALSDKYGRKAILTITAFNTGVALIVRSYSVSYEMYIATTFVGSFLGAGSFSACHLIATELFSKDIRALGAVTMSIGFCLGHVAIGLAAWALPNWRTLSRVLAYPQLLVIIYFFILDDSLRWLFSNGKYEQFTKSIKRAAKLNATELSSNTINELALITQRLDEIELSRLSSNETEEKHVSLIKQVFRSKVILRRLLITPFWWVSITLIYYGLTINSVNLYGNAYVNFVLVAIIDIPGYIGGYFGMNKIGRKITLCVSFAMCAIANFAFPLISLEYAWLHLVAYLIGKLFISSAVATVYQYTMEIYPTQLRHSFLAFSSMIGRIGSILAPQTPLLVPIWPPLPNVVFGVFAMISSLSILTMPETLGATLPDTIEDAENISKNK